MRTRTTPEAVDLKERITGLAIRVFGVEGSRVTPGFPIEQKVNGVPLSRRKILHGQVVPLWAD